MARKAGVFDYNRVKTLVHNKDVILGEGLTFKRGVLSHTLGCNVIIYTWPDESEYILDTLNSENVRVVYQSKVKRPRRR